MKEKKMDLTDERVAGQSRNITALIGISIMNGILAVAYLFELMKGVRSAGSYALVAALCILPVVLSLLSYWKKKDTIAVRYIASIGFILLYAYVIFTKSTNLTFCYVIVIFVILAVYADKKLSICLGALALLVNAADVAYRAATVGLTPIEITDIEIIFACLLLSGLFMLMTISKISLINQANIEKAEQERQQSERLLAMVVQAADAMAEGLGKATGETESLKRSIETTKGAMEELTCGAGDVVNAILIQQKNTEEINLQMAEVEEVTDSIISNVSGAEENLIDGKKNMDALLQQVVVSEAASMQVAEEMDELREYADQMQGILALINSVANQTGMLALNASIEAARAGEAGRGFAVVASEISSLAGQTSTATKDIDTLIGNITRSLGEVAEAVGGLLESNGLQNAYVNDTATSFETLHSSTQNVFTQMNRLKETVDVVAKANKSISESIGNVSAITEEVTAGANETLEGSKFNLQSVAEIVEIMESLNKGAEKLRQTEK